MRSASAVFCIVACCSGERQAQASSRVSLKRVTVSGSKYTASLLTIDSLTCCFDYHGFTRERDHSLTIRWPLPVLLFPAVRIYRQWFTIDLVTRDVRFAPESGHVQRKTKCRLRANIGHCTTATCKQETRLAAAFPTVA